MPGDLLPLRLLSAHDRFALSLAMTSSPPLSRLIAVVCCGNGDMAHNHFLHFAPVGCTAEIIKLGRDQMSFVVKARQRIRLHLDLGSGNNSGNGTGSNTGRSQQPLSLHRVAVTVIPDPPPPPIPPPTSPIRSTLPPWVWRQFDARALARIAADTFSRMIPRARCFQGSPDCLSFWLVQCLPFDNDHRQHLLELPNCIDRLNAELELAKQQTGLYCLVCSRRVCGVEDLLQVSDEGISAHFVNSHGVVHDLLTVENAHVRVVGNVESTHSWFPDFGWQICYCRRCSCHLGWAFSSITPPHAAEETFGENGTNGTDGTTSGQRDGGMNTLRRHHSSSSSSLLDGGGGGGGGEHRRLHHFFGLRRAAIKSSKTTGASTNDNQGWEFMLFRQMMGGFRDDDESDDYDDGGSEEEEEDRGAER